MLVSIRFVPIQILIIQRFSDMQLGLPVRQLAFRNFAVALVITHSGCKYIFVLEYRATKTV